MDDSIYSAAEDSELLAGLVAQKAFGRVLDMGTGSGIQAFTAAKVPGIRSVTAVDINPEAVQHVSEEAEKRQLSRFKVLESDLFSAVEGQFETIIFNAPYLPQDYLEAANGKKKAVVDLALYGGDKGYETIVRFLESVGEHLARGGKILLLFSSLSQKDVIDECLGKNLFRFEVLAESKQPMMETLYVYEITALPVRESILSLGVKDLLYHAKGSRGLVYKGKWDVNSTQKKFLASQNVQDVAIKIQRESSTAPGTLALEARNLRLVNKKGLGPRLYYMHKDFLIMEFVGGIPLDDFVKEKGVDSVEAKDALRTLLQQAYLLDTMRLQKEEMHRPYDNVLVYDANASVKLTLLDFERCRNTDSPSNVTQVVSFLMKLGVLERENGIALAETYKKTYSKGSFNAIFSVL